MGDLKKDYAKPLRFAAPESPLVQQPLWDVASVPVLFTPSPVIIAAFTGRVWLRHVPDNSQSNSPTQVGD
jgi:hypothetical protein